MFLGACGKTDVEDEPETQSEVEQEHMASDEESVAEESGTPEEAEKPKPITSMLDLYGEGTEAEQAYARFVDNKEYEPDSYWDMNLEAWLPPAEYAFCDLDQDGPPELILRPFGSWLCDLVYQYNPETKAIVYLGQGEGGEVQYSQAYKSLVYASESGSDKNYNFHSISYWEDGKKPSLNTTLMIWYREEDGGEPEISFMSLGDANGENGELTEEQYEGYVGELIPVEFAEIPSDPAMDLSQYLGQDVQSIEELIGDLQETESVSGYRQLTDGVVTVLAEPETGIVKLIKLRSGSDYTIEGIRITPLLDQMLFNSWHVILADLGWESSDMNSEIGEAKWREFTKADGSYARLCYDKGEILDYLESFCIYDSSIKDAVDLNMVK